MLDNATYRRLLGRAGSILRREGAGHGMEAADLVHEAFLRISRSDPPVRFQDAAHLVAVGTTVMRRILIDYSRSSESPKRNRRVALDSEMGVPAEFGEDTMLLYGVLDRLASCDARRYRIVHMRFFSGLGVDEIASALAISSRTVKRDWVSARGWLRREFGLEPTALAAN
jgi:RNA polymerase sigma factor (TIGR02999 family)